MTSRFPAGPRIRSARIAEGLSIEQVAVAIGRSAFSVHGYEQGRIEPPLHVLQIISELVGVGIDDLLLGNGSPV